MKLAVSMPTDKEMFAYCETQRALASGMTDRELAQFLVDNVLSSIRCAEAEFAYRDEHHERYKLECGVVREVAFRLSKLREYENEK